MGWSFKNKSGKSVSTAFKYIIGEGRVSHKIQIDKFTSLMKK